MILFLMLLCTTYCVHGMEDIVNLEGLVDNNKGIFSITNFDRIYANNVTDDGKGGTNISYAGAPLCLIGNFSYHEFDAKEEFMLPIEKYTKALLATIPDGILVIFKAHKSTKKVSLVMCPPLRNKIIEATKP